MHHYWLIVVVAAICGVLTSATIAPAATETWVSGTGTDAGGCTVSAPCKTFAYAHSKTSNNGAINVLSAGSFGPLTITKSISIVADGIEALINTGASGAGIVVQAGNGSFISLRGLTIEVTGNDGISFVSGAALHVQNCVIRRVDNGIFFAPASGTRVLTVADSLIADTDSSGIAVVPSGSGSARAVIERVRVKNAFNTGITFVHSGSGSINATVSDTVSAGGASSGIRAGGSTTVMVDRSTIVNNAGAGIFAVDAGATIRIGNSIVTGNNEGLAAAGGAIESYGTNKVDGNGSDGAPTSTIAMK